ncbi:MAG TPA: CBS domain-containing protein [Polyangiaceae bacterium]|nr:CBS domain-containing protein [Polyangiaceae bacterium]
MARLERTPPRDPERSWEVDFSDFGFGGDDALGAWTPPTERTPSSRRSTSERPSSVRIAHVLASNEGVEDVEVSLVCPDCKTKVVIDVAHEAALQTALSLLAARPAGNGLDGHSEAEREAHASPADRAREDTTWRARTATIREELSMLLMSLPVAEVMQRGTSAVRANARISSLSTLFAGEDLPGVIVVDEDDRPVGMITPGQFVRATCSVSRERFEGLHVRNVMLSRLFCVRADAPLARAMELFSDQGAKKIAVVGEDGKLAGALTPADMLHFLAG